MKPCKQCGKTIEYKPNANNVKFCSPICRTRSYYPARKEWFQNRHYTPSPNKIACLICGKYYRKVGSHVFNSHGMDAREYREEYNLEVKRGIVPPDLRETLTRNVIENGTIENLKKGQKYWFKKGQKGVGVYKRSPITIQRLKRNRFVYKNK